MALVTTPAINAVVAHIMQEKVGEYGPYQSVLFEGEGLEGGKLWRALKPEEVQQLRKGQAVELTPTKTSKGKASWNIRPLDTPPAQPQPTTPPLSQPQQRNSAGEATPTPQAQTAAAQPPRPEQIAEERRQQIAAYVDSMGDLYAHCLQVARQKLDDETDSETIRCMASSLFITADRRFRLTSSQ